MRNDPPLDLRLWMLMFCGMRGEVGAGEQKRSEPMLHLEPKDAAIFMGVELGGHISPVSMLGASDRFYFPLDPRPRSLNLDSRKTMLQISRMQTGRLRMRIPGH